MKIIQTPSFCKIARNDLLPGGLADDKETTDFNSKKLEQGKKVEKEHTSIPEIAEEIAMDHIAEDENYYDKLDKMEKK